MRKNTNTDFLSLVANDLLTHFGTDLSKITVVFPGVRASLFMNRYLYLHAQKPLWAPQYCSIESLFEKASSLQKGDNIQLIIELYDIYIQVYNRHYAIPSTETLDEFFFFGEILLNDFDDMDKNRVDVRALFNNLRDLNALHDNFSHLSTEQIEAIERHFKAIHGTSALKTAFWNIWNILSEVYETLKERLLKKKAVYPGLLMRSVMEEKPLFPSEHYVFVGFNALTRCEKDLFQLLKTKASFYWDYDTYYLNTKAGQFIRNNILQFGSALNVDNFDNFLIPGKKITLMASPSENGQSATVSPWIKSLHREPSFTQPDSAIILCNEAILPTVMHAIPSESVENVNITMGFPITQTAIASFLQVLTEMQTKGFRPSDKSFRYRYVLPVLRHPYTSIIFPEAKKVEQELINNNLFYPKSEQLYNAQLFKYTYDTTALAQYLLDIIQQVGLHYEYETTNTYTGLYQESVFRAYQIVNRLYGLLIAGNLTIDKLTFLRLLQRLLSTVKIPFHGEPIKGLQIMGILETRSLDFKNLLLLNVNEGFMPTSKADENTFIPQFLRIHFGMNTIEYRDSIYAYYFYRLLQRAKQITLVYNTDNVQTNKGEMSRFLLQLLTDPAMNDKIERFTLRSSIQPRRPQPIQVVKDMKLLQTIKNLYDLNTCPEANQISSSALNSYIDCSYQFYLKYVKGLRNKEEMSEELDNSIFGFIFHYAAELLYREITSKQSTVHSDDFDIYIRYPDKIRKLVLQAFKEKYFNGRSITKEDFNGEQLINFHVICKMLEHLIHFDKQRTPFTILGLEQKINTIFTLKQWNVRLNIGGVIDRLEKKDSSLCILDYKTGGKAKDYKVLEELFEQKADRATHIFQTFIYASALSDKEADNKPVIPALLYMRQVTKEGYSPIIRHENIPIKDFRTLNPTFRQLLSEKIGKLFDLTIPFQQTKITKICKYCDFREICEL